MAVFRFPEEESEGVKRLRGAEPGELVAHFDDVGAEFLFVFGADRAVDALRQKDHVGIGEAILEGFRIDAFREMQANADFLAAPVQELQKRHARTPCKAVAADHRARALVLDNDVAPIGEAVPDHLVGFGIGAEKLVKRFIGKDNAETERIVGPVLFVNVDFAIRQALFGQEREIKSARTAADNRDFHRLSPIR